MKNALIFIALAILLIIILRSKAFKAWRMGRNKTEAQKKAIKFLVYGPSQSGLSVDDYDEICRGMYPIETIFEKAKAKLGISDSDIVRHPCKDIDATYLFIRNYVEYGTDVLSIDLDNNTFRSSKMDSLMVIFGRDKLHFYQFSYFTDKTEATENSYSYAYEDINQFKVSQVSSRNGSIYASINLRKEISEEDAKDEQKRKNSYQSFPSMMMDKECFDRWAAIGTHLDSPALREEYKDKTDDEKDTIRYFKAYYNLPLALTDKEYEEMIVKTLPSEELRDAGMDNMGIEEDDIQLAAPISFRSFVYNQGTLEIKGRDGSWRSNNPQHTWLFFGKHQIYVYAVSMLLDRSIKQQSTQEIFYKDISSIRTEQLSQEKVEGDKVYILSYYKFTMIFSGDSISLTLPILTDENDKKIRAMRNLLRETKHSSALGEAEREDTV